MTADVYAADDALSGDEVPRHNLGIATFRVRTDVSPDVMLRVTSQLNSLNQAPLNAVLRRVGDDEVLFEIAIPGCTRFAAEMVCRRLSTLTCAIEVSYVFRPEQVAADAIYKSSRLPA
ncbi:MAG: hypothetical protein ABI885_29055 [Gammaproteobacteria bacterium]